MRVVGLTSFWSRVGQILTQSRGILPLWRSRYAARVGPPTQSFQLPPSGRVGRARVALVTIIPEEFDAARNVFNLNAHLPETVYFVDDPDHKVWDVVLMQATDRSNVPVMGDVLTLMEELRPQVIILLGIAGGLCDGSERGRDNI